MSGSPTNPPTSQQEPSHRSIWRGNKRATLLLFCLVTSAAAIWCLDLGWQQSGGVTVIAFAMIGWGACLYLRRFTRMRFRMSDLFVLTTVIAVCLGAVVQISRVRMSERILDQLTQQGCQVAYEVQFESRSSGGGFFVSQSGRILPNWCAQLLGKSYFSQIKTLSFAQTAVPLSDEDVSLFGRLPHYRNLNLSKTDITSEGLARLTGSSQLESLTLNSSQLDEASAKYLRGRFPRLKQIRVSRSVIMLDSHVASLQHFDDVSQLKLLDKQISNSALQSLTKLKQLTSLTIGGKTTITSQALKQLKQLTSIEQLVIHDIKGVNIEDFAGMVKLQDLQFHQCTFSQPDFRVLRRLPVLTRLSVRQTSLTEKHVEQLAEIQQLEAINLQKSPLSIRGLRRITTLPLLRELQLTGIPINDETIEIFRLNKAIRGIHIDEAPDPEGKAVRMIREVEQLDAVWVNGEYHHRRTVDDSLKMKNAN